MNRPLVIVGCGGHGREIHGIVRDVNRAGPEDAGWTVVGFVDDGPADRDLKLVADLGAAYLGTTSWLDRATDVSYVIGIGTPEVRAQVAGRLAPTALPAAPLVHPAATVGADTRLGDGTVLYPGARVTTNVSLGRHVHLNQNATVGHDAVLEDCVSVNPLAAVSGGCRLGPAVLVGAAAAVLQGVRMGAAAVAGACACVTRDVPAGAVVTGVPARCRDGRDDEPRWLASRGR